MSAVPVKNFRHVKVGDTVERLLAGQIPHDLVVTKIDDDLIYCGFADPRQAWTFDRDTGVEVDHDLRWGPQYGRTGSYLVGASAREALERES